MRVRNIIDKCRSEFGDRFNFYLTGSYARNEKVFKDYDIAIYDNENNNNDWENLLSKFYNKKEDDGKLIDAQIDQFTKDIMNMNGKQLYDNRDKIVKRYFYSDKKIEDWDYVKYKNISGHLWEKEIMLVKPKHRSMGLDRVKRLYKEI